MGLIYLVLLWSMVRVLKGARGEVERQYRGVLEGTMIVQLVLIVQWGLMGGEGMEWVEGYRWLGGEWVIMVGVDDMNVWLLILTGVLMPVTVIVIYGDIRYLEKEYLLMVLLMEGLLIGVFVVMDLVGFYVLYEATVIPMYIIVGVWGVRGERVRAAYYLLMYTVVGSVILLLGIVGIYGDTGETGLGMLRELRWGEGVETLLYAGIVLGMMVKIPVMPFHIWLPQAHVEAPLGGSIILAGVLLKIGGYGMIRYMWGIVPEVTSYYGPVVDMLALLGVLYGGLITCRQVDMKRVIAYASIGHMGIVVMGIMVGTREGMMGGMYMMVVHGLVSGGLFIAAIMLYGRYGTRLIRYYRGLWVTMPLYSVGLLLLIMANAGMPLSGGYVGEVEILLSVYGEIAVKGVMGALGGLLGVVYGFMVYIRVVYGQPRGRVRDMNRRESTVMLVVIVGVYGLGVWPWIVGVEEPKGGVVCGAIRVR